MMTRNFFGLIIFSLFFTPYSFAGDKPYTDTPVARFGLAEPGIFRGGEPKSVDALVDIRNKGIKTVVSLITDPKKIAWEKGVVESLGMRYLSMPLPGFNAPKDEQVRVVQGWLNDKRLKPLFIHCSHGRERTGMMIGLYKVFTRHWPAPTAYAEMKQWGFRSIVFPMKNYFKRVTGMKLQSETILPSETF